MSNKKVDILENFRNLTLWALVAVPHLLTERIIINTANAVNKMQLTNAISAYIRELDQCSC
jgi:hypothetical protein